MAESQQQASYYQPSFEQYCQLWRFLDDIWEGLATQEKLALYLPRRGRAQSLESNESYQLRLQTTSLPRSFRDGIEKSVGKFGLATLDDDSPEPIAALEENIDGKGLQLDTLVSNLIQSMLRYGSAAILVDVVDVRPAAMLVPVESIRNVDGQSTLQRLTIASEEQQPDGYGFKAIPTYREYTAGALLVWQQQEDDDELVLTETIPLTNAAGEPRGEVYAVWFTTDSNVPDWEPPSPPFAGLAKTCVRQMLKESELDRAETICNMQILKRYHPDGTDFKKPLPPIAWDPEVVQEIPFGGDIKIDEPGGTAIQITHQRNLDRQAMMDRAVDSWLLEKIRTATESALADKAEMSRLEILSKEVVSGMSQVFDFMMRLADRRYVSGTDEPGGITLSGTAYEQVTDSEIQLATQDYMAGTLSLAAIQSIKSQQWRSRGYDIPDEDGGLLPLAGALGDQVIEAE